MPDVRRGGLLLPLFLLAVCPLAAFAGQDPPPRDVTDIDLDDLVNVRVTSASRKEQPLADVPAAIYVVRGDDVVRVGATSIPEALRGVPGVHVARNSANTWAVCPRGFGDELSNKLLVLIDGRSVYSPLHSGVYWDVQDTMLEDLDRIEVIRGPGGSLWGANAINGVVNVTTKRADETLGGLVTLGGGTEERAFGAARYGFKVGDDVAVRVYAKYLERDDARDGVDPDHHAHDGWFMARGGFRADWKAGDQDRVAVLADYYDGQIEERVFNTLLSAPFNEVILDRANVRGADAIFRWDRTFNPSSGFTVQMYYDYTFQSTAVFTDVLHTADLDFQHRFSPFDGNDLIWGVGYRIYRSVMRGSNLISVAPEGHTDDVVSGFVQDELALVKDRLRLTLGSKFEHNDYSGFEYQPSGRLAWIPGEQHLFWGSVSRAVRTPSILDHDGRLNPIVVGGAPPLEFGIIGNHEFKSEHLLAYEAGYRVRPADPLSLDLALFYNRYDRVRSGTVGAPFVETDPPPTHVVIPVNLANDLHGQTRGIELAANLQAASWWLLQANYSYLHMNQSASDVNRRSPHHQVWVRSATDLPANLTMDVTARYVSELRAFDLVSYTEVDVRLAWRDDARRVEAAVVGQNLVHTTHAEFDAADRRSAFQRGVYASLTWRF